MNSPKVRVGVATAVATLVALVVAPRSFAIAGMADTVIVVGDVTWEEQLAQWAKQFEQWDQQINQARRVADFAMTLKDFAGDPKLAVQNLGEVSGIVSSLGRTFGQEQTTDAWAKNITAADFFERAGDRLYGDTKAFTDTFTSNGVQYHRSPSLYQATMALEGAVKGTKALIEENRKTEAEIIKKANEASDKLAKNPKPTESDKQAASFEMQRLAVLQGGVVARNASATAELQLKQEEDKIAKDSQYLSTMESVQKSVQQQTDARDKLRVDMTDKIVATLKPIEADKTTWSNVLLRDVKTGTLKNTPPPAPATTPPTTSNATPPPDSAAGGTTNGSDSSQPNGDGDLPPGT